MTYDGIKNEGKKRKKSWLMVSWFEWHPSKIGAYLGAQNVISFENGVFGDVISGEEVILG